MDLTLDLGLILQTVMGGGILLAIRWAVNTLTANLREIQLSLLDLNTRTVHMESWQVSHDKQDDERHQTTQDTMGKIWSKMDAAR